MLSLQYADDVIIYTSHKDKNINKTNIEHGLRILENEISKIHMGINANKSKLICFSRKKQNELDNNVIMTKGQVITVLVDCIKLQKVYIDNKFTFSKHIDQIICNTSAKH